jgi:glycosyltransferase involved in cell wall biosynthesis
VARLDPVKDHATLVRAFALLAAKLPDVHLAIVGDGPCRAALEALAAELGPAGRIHFAGMQPNRPNPHHLFDVSALTSLSEGFPNSVVEAMAAARPVVATDVGGMRDALVDGVTGRLVPAGDPTALADALAGVLGDSAGSQAMGRAGRERAEALFSAEPVIAGLLSLYGELARR